PLRLLGDGLAACFNSRPDLRSVAVVNDLGSLRNKLSTNDIQAVLVDVGWGVDVFDIRAIATEWADVPLIALGLNEQRQEVIACGRAGYAGYVPLEASIDELCQTLHEIVA